MLAQDLPILGAAIVMASVELRRVSKVFSRGVVALRDVDLQVRDGEIFVLLGPNGSGKTTLLRLIAGLDRPSSGEVRIGERVVNRVAPRRRNIAMVFQGCVLYPHLTVERNIAFGLDRRYGGWPARLWNRLASRIGVPDSAKSQEIRQRIRHTAKFLGVEHLLDRFPRQLSGGECQRVALGRAFVRQPAVFLLDEPWSNVDARLRQPLRHELRRLREDNRGTTILVTHDHVEALALGDRIAVLERGRVHQVGTPAEVVSDPQSRFVAEFVGNPPMNFVAGQWTRREDFVRFESPAWRLDGKVFGSAKDIGPLENTGSLESVVPSGNHPAWLGFRTDAVAIQLQPSSEKLAQEKLAQEKLILCGVVVGSEVVAGETQVMVKSTRSGWQETSEVPLVVKVAGGTSFPVGQEVWLVVDAGRSHFFDQQSGARIYPGLEVKSK